MTSKVTSWFITEKGKRFIFAAACSTSIAIFSAYTLPNTWLIDKYKELKHLYKSGTPVQVSEIVQNRFDSAVNLLGIPEINKKRITTFMVSGFDIFNCGTTYSKFGGLVGIPINFEFNNVENIEKTDLLIDNEPIDWNNTESEQFLNSLVLTEKAQLYAIAREISMLNSPKLLLDTFYGTSIFITMYGIGNSFNTKYNLYAKPTSIRGAMYSMIAFFGFGLYAFLTDLTQSYFEKQIDDDLCKKNIIFVEGGKEFYEKIVQRNLSLRKLLGPYGERKYSDMGNENYFVRQKSLPILMRKDFFVNQLNKSNILVN